MAKFHFPLEALLEHRVKAEEEHQRKVAGIQAQINQLMDQVTAAQRTIQEQNRDLAERGLIGRLDLSYITTEKRYVGNLHVTIVYILQKMAAFEKSLLVARAELLAATKARKVLDKLKENQLARWREHQNRLDAAATDEIGTQMALRNLAELEAAEEQAPVVSHA